MDIDSIRARGYVSYFILAVILAVFLIFINFSTFHLNFKNKFFKSFFSFMKYRYKYYPLRNLDQIIFDVIKNKIPSGLVSTKELLKIDLNNDVQLKFEA